MIFFTHPPSASWVSQTMPTRWGRRDRYVCEKADRDNFLVSLSAVMLDPLAVNTSEGGDQMANKDEYLNAAKKRPSQRSSAEQRLVDSGRNMQDVRNADHEAHRQERIHGGR